MVETVRRFKFGWFGDNGLGEKMIQSIITGHKTATCCPAYDPEDAEFKVGDYLDLTDKHGRVRARLVVVRIELRPYGSFDQALAAAEGIPLGELIENTRFANGRELRPDEEMRVIHFRMMERRAS